MPYLKIHTDPVHSVRGLLFSSPAIGKRGKGARSQSILGRVAVVRKPPASPSADFSPYYPLPQPAQPCLLPRFYFAFQKDLPYPSGPVLWCGHNTALR